MNPFLLDIISYINPLLQIESVNTAKENSDHLINLNDDQVVPVIMRCIALSQIDQSLSELQASINPYLHEAIHQLNLNLQLDHDEIQLGLDPYLSAIQINFYRVTIITLNEDSASIAQSNIFTFSNQSPTMLQSLVNQTPEAQPQLNQSLITLNDNVDDLSNTVLLSENTDEHVQ